MQRATTMMRSRLINKMGQNTIRRMGGGHVRYILKFLSPIFFPKKKTTRFDSSSLFFGRDFFCQWNLSLSLLVWVIVSLWSVLRLFLTQGLRVDVCVSVDLKNLVFFSARGADFRSLSLLSFSCFSISLSDALVEYYKKIYVCVNVEIWETETRTVYYSLSHSLSLSERRRTHIATKWLYRIRPPFNLRSTKFLWDVSRSVFRSEESASSETLSTFRTESTDSIRTPVRIRRKKSIGCVVCVSWI
jgi:hypothetical protein